MYRILNFLIEHKTIEPGIFVSESSGPGPTAIETKDWRPRTRPGLETFGHVRHEWFINLCPEVDVP